MTAGREQDARETLARRMLLDVADTLDKHGLDGNAAAIREALALLPSPPATTGPYQKPPLGEIPVLPPTHYCPDHEGSRYGGPPCRNCVPIPAPPATTGAAALREALIDAEATLEGCSDGADPLPIARTLRDGAARARAALAAASPPATDGDAAADADDPEWGDRVTAARARGDMRPATMFRRPGFATDDDLGATETGTPGPAAGGGDDE